LYVESFYFLVVIEKASWFLNNLLAKKAWLAVCFFFSLFSLMRVVWFFHKYLYFGLVDWGDVEHKKYIIYITDVCREVKERSVVTELKAYDAAILHNKKTYDSYARVLKGEYVKVMQSQKVMAQDIEKRKEKNKKERAMLHEQMKMMYTSVFIEEWQKVIDKLGDIREMIEDEVKEATAKVIIEEYALAMKWKNDKVLIDKHEKEMEAKRENYKKIKTHIYDRDMKGVKLKIFKELAVWIVAKQHYRNFIYSTISKVKRWINVAKQHYRNFTYSPIIKVKRWINVVKRKVQRNHVWLVKFVLKNIFLFFILLYLVDTELFFLFVSFYEMYFIDILLYVQDFFWEFISFYEKCVKSILLYAQDFFREYISFYEKCVKPIVSDVQDFFREYISFYEKYVKPIVLDVQDFFWKLISFYFDFKIYLFKIIIILIILLILLLF
jgi:hypothetical protein